MLRSVPGQEAPAARRTPAGGMIIVAALMVVSMALVAAAEEVPAELPIEVELLIAMDRGAIDDALWARIDRRTPARLRAQAVRVLAATADPTTLPKLEKMLGDPDPEVQEQLMLAAGRIGDDGQRLVRGGLASLHANVRRAAAWAACHLGGVAGRTLLERLPAERDPDVLAMAAANLWRLEEGSWEELATSLAARDDQELRRAVAVSLARGGTIVRMPVLRRLAADDNGAVRATALGGLRTGPLAAADHGVILAALEDEQWQVQVAACSVLAERPEITLSDEVLQSIRGMWQPRLPQLAVAALRVAAVHDEVASVEQLVGLTAGADSWLAAEALQVLVRRDARVALEVAKKWLSAQPSWKRRAAARAVAMLDGGDGGDDGELSRTALASDDAAVRLAWLDALPELRHGPNVLLIKRLMNRDPDAAVRAQALSMVQRSWPMTSVEEALELYDGWQEDALADARIEALSAAVAAASSEAEWLEIEKRATGDPDRGLTVLVLARARAAGRRVATPPRAPRHEVDWYVQLAEWQHVPSWIEVVTDRGSFQVELDTEAAPLTCRAIWDLAAAGFYNGLDFHRVVPNFVVQGGDPRGDGWGGPGWTLPDEPTLEPFAAGRVGIATSGPNTGGCQIFAMLLRSDRLAGHYTNFGQVIAGQEVLERLRVGDRIHHVVAISGRPPLPPPPVLLGELAWETLAEIDGWETEYDEYEPDPEAIELLRSAECSYRVVTVLGTWCGDSAREVPRLVAVLDRVDNEAFELVLDGVDRTRRTEPAGPAAAFLSGRAVRLLPTILVLDEGGRELGRIEEIAEGPVEQLLVEFLRPVEGW